jgi:hypothetical protein
VPPAGDEVSAGRRIIRAVLILAILGAGGYVLVGLEPGDGSIARRMGSGITAPPEPAEMKTDEADALAEDLAGQIDAGNLDPVLDRAAELRVAHPNHFGVQRVVLLAESARAVLNAADRLASLAQAEPQNPAVPISVNIKRLRERMAHLDVLQAQHRDWRDRLLRISRVRDVYAQYHQEIASAPQQLADWQAGRRYLHQALEEISRTPPAFETGMSLLQSAWGYLPLEEILGSIENIRHVSQAHELLDHSVVKRAVEEIKQVNPDAIAMPSPSSDVDLTLLQRINREVLALWSEAREEVGAWDELNRALETAQRQYGDGRVAAALSTIDQALPKADPDNALTRDLVGRLSELKQHYRRVHAAWTEAVQTKQRAGLAEQLKAWSAFQKVLRPSDQHFRQAFRDELMAIKETITERIDTHYEAMRRASAGYTSITLQMRKPQNPREPFAEQAGKLAAMAEEAEKVRDTAELVPNWDLGEETTARVDEARAVLGEHNDQARRLNNLYKLYHRLGKVHLARECLQRVRLLGDGSSNPWYAEALKILES